MGFFEQLVDKKLVSFMDICKIVGNKDNANKVIAKYLKQGYIARVKKDLYVAINLETKEPIANKFMIASNISDDSIICGLSALEYYGFYNQVRNDVFVMSNTRFREFKFNNLFYRRVKFNYEDGISNVNNFIRITDLERSIVDVIKDLGKIVSLEELSNILSLIPSLDEEKLKLYLKKYDIQFLYQKVGFVLENYKEEFGLSDLFFENIKSKIKTKRYLFNNEKKVVYNSEWMLIVPKILERKDDYAIY
jgi:predicted transcriptional regulator of viral defense system